MKRVIIVGLTTLVLISMIAPSTLADSGFAQERRRARKRLDRLNKAVPTEVVTEAQKVYPLNATGIVQ